MVVNLCLPHFSTTVHCNKLCADGYDVTNLVSADPAVRRRGFKLEYFLRPPVQVTLKFGFQVELCRVDVELWPWGMDRGQACKRLEISTCSDPPQDHQQPKESQKVKTQTKVASDQTRGESQRSHGQQWSLQAQQWGEETSGESGQRGHASEPQSHRPAGSEPEFKLVARCELREETQVCFTRANFRPRAPFLSPPPPRPAGSRQEDLWSRGLLSLGAVTQLRVSVPFGGAASSLGLKALTVWGQPARCCPADEVERIKRVHQARERQLKQPAFFASPVKRSAEPLRAAPNAPSVPEDFLDPITQEVMLLPMLLPCGVSVDNATLEEHQKREATWGRAPNDPFTGVPFSPSSQPLPNPQLKLRIDHFLLERGMSKRDGMLGRRDQGDSPQASRLVSPETHKEAREEPRLVKNITESKTTNGTLQTENSSAGLPFHNLNYTSNVQSFNTNRRSALDRSQKRDRCEISKGLIETSTAEDLLQPQTKRPKDEALPAPSYSSHEQRLSSSLDEALLSALQGRPSFTSNLPQQQVIPDPEPQTTAQRPPASNLPSISAAGEAACSACSSSISVYSASSSSVYRLACGHLLCRPCLQNGSEPSNSASVATSNHVACPTCRRSTPRGHITRVHH